MSSAQTMKIFSIINRIKQELEESPRSKFGGTTKRVVEVERLLDLLEDLKVVIPEDIRRATGIISEADNLLADAKESAQDIVEQAHQEADTILSQAEGEAAGIRSNAQSEFETRVSESEVYNEAFRRASGIASEAEENANAIYNGARKYADEILVDLQRYLAEYHQMIEQNRKELGFTEESVPVPVAVKPAAPETKFAPEPPAAYAQPQYAEQPRYNEAQYMEQPRPQAPHSQTARQPRVAPHTGVERMPMDDDPGLTRQFARPDRMSASMDEVEPPRRPAPRMEEPPKKKGLFQRILEADDEDDEELEEDEGWTENVEPKKAPKEKEKKPRKRLIEFIEADDDEEEEDY